MPSRDTARAELAARQRAALYRERHIIEGTVVTLFAQSIPIDIDTGEDHQTLRHTLEDLLGKRVRVTIELLPEGANGASNDAP